jgi:polysaccharide export outer membrane protein
VGAPSIVPLNASGTRLMDVIARSGGATYPPYDSYVTVTRGNKTAMVLLQSVLDYPSENIPLRPGDQVYVTYDPRTFTALGAISRVGKIKFESQHLTLIEAGALAGGGDDTKADPKGYFVFRFENPEIVKVVIGHKRFNELVAAGMTPDENGNYPIVYRIDMSKPQSMLTGQVFPIANRDVIYVSRHPTRDFLKFVELVSAPLAFAAVVKSVD